MNIEPFGHRDIPDFIALARSENWEVDSWEPEFLLSRHSGHCFLARGDHGKAIGFITSMRHDTSGWIGNLIVAPEARRRGIGEGLFLTALATLRTRNTATIWLTASEMGAGLYQRHGFRECGVIARWVGYGHSKPQRLEPPPIEQLDGCLAAVDSAAWGDDRSELVAVTTGRGVTMTGPAGFMTVQTCGAAYQLGPWSASNSGQAVTLLDRGLKLVGSGMKIMTDAPLANRNASRILKRRGFIQKGRNLLMCAGRHPAWQPDMIYGLATMGSCG